MGVKVKDTPSVEYINECFVFNPKTGTLTWKERPLYHFKNEWRRNQSNSRNRGKNVSCKEAGGYLVVKLEGQTYKAHRLIWKMFYGEDATFIDHINGDRTDNRIDNIRSVSFSENTKNRKISKNNTSTHQGVYWHTKHKKYGAYIDVDGKRLHLSWTDSFEEAKDARIKAEANYYNEFRRKQCAQ